MGFVTKVDFSNNRQVKQYEKTLTSLSGGTEFGAPYSALTTGPDLISSALTQTYTNVISYFSGNTGSTIFYWGDPNMVIGEYQISAITPSNSGMTQLITPVFATSLTATTVDGNVYSAQYSGVSYDIKPLTFVDLGGSYSGSLETSILNYYSAGTIDFTGRTIWVDVKGITRTDELIVSKNSYIGWVLTCVDSEGRVAWQPLGAYTGFWSATTIGPPSEGIAIINSDSVASAPYSLAEGFQTQALGNFSHAEGLNTIANDSCTHAEGFQTYANRLGSHAEGSQTQAIGVTSHSQGELTIASGDWSHSGGKNTVASGITSFVHGENSIAIGKSTIVLGDNLTGNTNNHTYVGGLNINLIGPGPSVIDVGVDANGYVVDTASDISLKENIETIDSALNKLIRLRGVYYNWVDKKSGGENKKIGFIAQEVEKVIPELVHTHNNGLKSVNYKDVTALIVEAVKELVSVGKVVNYLETQTVVSEDNNIEFNYGGNNETSIDGGIIVLHAMGDNKPAKLTTNKDGDWETNNSFIPKQLILPINTPKSSSDLPEFKLGSLITDDDYMYIKTSSGWKRTKMEEF